MYIRELTILALIANCVYRWRFRWTGRLQLSPS